MLAKKKASSRLLQPFSDFYCLFTDIHKNIWSKLSEIVVNSVLHGIIAIRLLFEKLFKKIKKWDSLHNAAYIYCKNTAYTWHEVISKSRRLKYKDI